MLYSVSTIYISSHCGSNFANCTILPCIHPYMIASNFLSFSSLSHFIGSIDYTKTDTTQSYSRYITPAELGTNLQYYIIMLLYNVLQRVHNKWTIEPFGVWWEKLSDMPPFLLQVDITYINLVTRPSEVISHPCTNYLGWERGYSCIIPSHNT